MKIFIAFILSIFLNVSFADVAKKPKALPKKFSQVICNQKYFPMKIEQALNGPMLTVRFIAQRQLEQFVIKSVRGLDGLQIKKFQDHNITDLKKGHVVSSLVELSEYTGLVYVVFDVAVTVNGETRGYSLPIAIGKLSEQQKAERSKNIKEEKVPGDKKSGNALSTPPKKYHEMQVD